MVSVGGRARTTTLSHHPSNSPLSPNRTPNPSAPTQTSCKFRLAAVLRFSSTPTTVRTHGTLSVTHVSLALLPSVCTVPITRSSTQKRKQRTRGGGKEGARPQRSRPAAPKSVTHCSVETMTRDGTTSQSHPELIRPRPRTSRGLMPGTAPTPTSPTSRTATVRL